MECPGDGKSIRCEVPDEQIGRIVGAVMLPEAWLDRVLAQVHLADEVKADQRRKERSGASSQTVGTSVLG